MLKDLKISYTRNTQKALFNHTKESHSPYFEHLCLLWIYKRWSIWLAPSQDCTPRIPPSFFTPVMHMVLPVLPMKELVGCAALAGANSQPQKFEWLGVGGHTLGWLQKDGLKMFSEMRISPLTAYIYISALPTNLNLLENQTFLWCMVPGSVSPSVGHIQETLLLQTMRRDILQQAWWLA